MSENSNSIQKRIIQNIKKIIKTKPSARTETDRERMRSVSEDLGLLRKMRKAHVVLVKRTKTINIDR